MKKKSFDKKIIVTYEKWENHINPEIRDIFV